MKISSNMSTMVSCFVFILCAQFGTSDWKLFDEVSETDGLFSQISSPVRPDILGFSNS